MKMHSTLIQHQICSADLISTNTLSLIFLSKNPLRLGHAVLGKLQHLERQIVRPFTMWSSNSNDRRSIWNYFEYVWTDPTFCSYRSQTYQTIILRPNKLQTASMHWRASSERGWYKQLWIFYNQTLFLSSRQFKGRLPTEEFLIVFARSLDKQWRLFHFSTLFHVSHWLINRLCSFPSIGKLYFLSN